MHLIAPRQEKKTTPVSQSEPAMDNASFGIPQEDKIAQTVKAPDQSRHVPPQEKADAAVMRVEQARPDHPVGRVQDQLNQRRIESEESWSTDERAQYKQQKAAMLSCAAGVTGEDFGIAEKQRVVRS